MSLVAVLYTGGKDSTYALSKLDQADRVACLITIKSSNPDSYMLHTASIDMTRLGAAALELPLFCGETEGAKDTELLDISETLKRAKREFGFDTIATGALASVYQKSRIEKIADSLGLEIVSPLWGRDQRAYLKGIVEEGFRFVLTSVSCEGLDSSFLGKVVTPEICDGILKRSEKYGFNPAFEGGEAETLVLDCPLFRKNRIKLTQTRTVWDGYTGSLQIEKAVLERKNFIQ